MDKKKGGEGEEQTPDREKAEKLSGRLATKRIGNNYQATELLVKILGEISGEFVFSVEHRKKNLKKVRQRKKEKERQRERK